MKVAKNIWKLRKPIHQLKRQTSRYLWKRLPQDIMDANEGDELEKETLFSADAGSHTQFHQFGRCETLKSGASVARKVCTVVASSTQTWSGFLQFASCSFNIVVPSSVEQLHKLSSHHTRLTPGGFIYFVLRSEIRNLLITLSGRNLAPRSKLNYQHDVAAWISLAWDFYSALLFVSHADVSVHVM